MGIGAKTGRVPSGTAEPGCAVTIFFRPSCLRGAPKRRSRLGEASGAARVGATAAQPWALGRNPVWDSGTERDSANRSRFASTEIVGCFRRNIASGSAAVRRHVERRKSTDPKVPIGTTESSPRFQPWLAIGEWPEPRRGDRKDGTGPVRSFVPDGTRFMFAPQPSDKSLGYFRASLRDVESRHAKHVQSPRLPSRSRSASALIRSAGIKTCLTPMKRGLTAHCVPIPNWLRLSNKLTHGCLNG